jgi:putative endonuclease
MRARLYFVYILASRSRRLYIGVTNNLMLRLWQHRAQRVEFTARYRITSLVHVDTTGDVRSAIAREKELKGWRREKKIELIERDNPAWRDLASNWFK